MYVCMTVCVYLWVCISWQRTLNKGSRLAPPPAPSTTLLYVATTATPTPTYAHSSPVLVLTLLSSWWRTHPALTGPTRSSTQYYSHLFTVLPSFSLSLSPTVLQWCNFLLFLPLSLPPTLPTRILGDWLKSLTPLLVGRTTKVIDRSSTPKHEPPPRRKG